MTISTTTNKIQYTGDGTTNNRTFPFIIYEESDLQVISREIATAAETVLVLNTDYTITGVGDESGGYVTPLSAWPSTHTYLIRCILDLTQESNLIDNDAPAETTEIQFDRQIKIAQQLQEQVDRSVKVARTCTSVPSLPAPEANKVIAWDADGSGLANLSNLTGSASAVAVSLYAQTLLDDTGSAEARTTLGAIGQAEFSSVSAATAVVQSSLEAEHTSAGIHEIPYWPQAPAFNYTSGDTMVIGAGAIYWKNKIYHWDSDLTFNLTSAGSNADSSNIGGEDYQFIYADWSAGSGSAELSAGCFVNTSAAPTWNSSAKAFMSGDDLYIGHFHVVSSALAEFYHCCGDDLVMWAEYVATNIAATDVDTTFVDCQFKNPNCGKRTKVVSILYAPSGLALNSIYYREKGAATSVGQFLGISSNTSPGHSSHILHINSTGLGQFKRTVSNADLLTVVQQGHFLLK